MRMRTTIQNSVLDRVRMDSLSFLTFFVLVREINPLNPNNIKPWPWTHVQPPFPKPGKLIGNFSESQLLSGE